MPAMQKTRHLCVRRVFDEGNHPPGDEVEDPFFFFAVTLQGHGPYEANPLCEEHDQGRGDLPEADRQVLATYAQGVKEADTASDADGPGRKSGDRETIIVLFGDHLSAAEHRLFQHRLHEGHHGRAQGTEGSDEGRA